MNHAPFFSRAVPFACAFLCATAAAQKAPPGATTDSSAADEVITLPEFSVSADSRKDEYVASEAISGTRTGSPIIDIPFNVQVLTNELIEDFQLMTEYNEFPTIPNYASGDGDDEKLNTNDGGNKQLRGFTPITMRDGFSRAGPSNIANTNQVEVIMGPQSALYGQASPGGILNYVSKRPRQQFWNRLTLATGSYDNQRAEIEFNGPVIPKRLFGMVNASYNFRTGASNFSQIRSKSYLAGLTYLISPKTSLSVNWEQQFTTSLQAAGAPKLVIGSTPSKSNPSATGGIDVGPYTALGRFNRLGPIQDKYSRFDNLSALIEHRFNAIFSARVNLLYYHRDWDDETWTSGLQLDASTMRMRARQPTKRLQTVDDYAVQTELLTQFSTGELNHKFLIAADYVRDIYDNAQWYLPSSGTYAIGNVLSLDTRYLNPYNPKWETVDYSLVTRVGSSLRRVYQHEGLATSFRTYALKQRLVTSLSCRYSYTDADIQNRMTPAQSGAADEEGVIYSLGVNYKLRGNAAVIYANTSTSYEPSTTYDQGLGRPIAAEKGKGVETGIKGSLLDQRFNYTLSLYHIEKRNIRESNPDYDETVPGSPQYLTSGEVRARGGEVVATLIPVRSLTLISSFGYTDAEVTRDDPANIPSTVGKRPLYVPRYTASFLTSYGFSQGVLKGLKLRLNTTYTGNRISQYDDTKSTSPGKKEYITPSLFLLSAGVTYEFKLGGHFRQSVSLDGQNLLDKEYYTPGNFTRGRGRSGTVTYRVNF